MLIFCLNFLQSWAKTLKDQIPDKSAKLLQSNRLTKGTDSERGKAVVPESLAGLLWFLPLQWLLNYYSLHSKTIVLLLVWALITQIIPFYLLFWTMKLWWLSRWAVCVTEVRASEGRWSNQLGNTIAVLRQTIPSSKSYTWSRHLCHSLFLKFKNVLANFFAPFKYEESQGNFATFLYFWIIVEEEWLYD